MIDIYWMERSENAANYSHTPPLLQVNLKFVFPISTSIESHCTIP
jgi:hypothetical protein